MSCLHVSYSNGTHAASRFTLGIDTSTRAQIDNYVGAQAIIQNIDNPSGGLTTGGLGEL